MTRPGWTRLTPVTRQAGRCGGMWLHKASDWRIVHCGHPTANWPYYLCHPDYEPETVVSHNGKGFCNLAATMQMVEEIAQGQLAITTGGCVEGVARIPTRGADGSTVPARDDSYWGLIQRTWTATA